MLVLSRKEGESITINDQIKITIVGTRGRVRVGIDAPKHMSIIRDELIKTSNSHNKLTPTS